MSLSKANIRTEIRTLLHEAAAGFFVNTQIDNWIDQAAVDISSKTLCYEASDEITLAEKYLEYSIPSGCIKVVTCQLDKKGLVRIYPRHMGHISDTIAGPPGFYYEFAAHIGFWPVCDAANNGKKVTVLSSKQTNVITNIVDQYRPYAILYGLYRGLLKDKKYASASNIISVYLDKLLFHRQDLQERPPESWDMMKLAQRILTVKK